MEILSLLKNNFPDKESPYAFRALACLSWMNEKAQNDLRSCDFLNVLVKSIRKFRENATFITEASYALCGCFDGHREDTAKICEESTKDKLILDILLDAVNKDPENENLASKVCLAVGSLAFSGVCHKQLFEEKQYRWKTLISVYKMHRKHAETMMWVSFAISNNLNMWEKSERLQKVEKFSDLTTYLWSDLHLLSSHDQTCYFMNLMSHLIGLPVMLKKLVDEPSSFEAVFEVCCQFKCEAKYLKTIVPFQLRITSTPVGDM